MNTEKKVERYYRQGNVIERIVGALGEQGKTVEAVTSEDLSFFDEFHVGGRLTTVKLAQEVGLESGWQVLDIGCGIGGPARTLTIQFQCRVSGLDITGEYCQAAAWLSQKVGLGNKIKFVHGSALNIPFNDEHFEVVWMQHVSMNIKDKKRLLTEARRVLKRDGKLALHEILSGPVIPVYYPLGWAQDESTSFLVQEAQFRNEIISSGFLLLSWSDVTKEFLEIIGKQQKRAAVPSKPPPGLAVLVPNEAMLKARNMLRNMKENRLTVIRAVFQKHHQEI